MLKYKTLFRALISLGLLSYLIYLADPHKVISALSASWHQGGIIYIICALIVFIISIIVYAWRWKVLLSGYGLDISVYTLFRFYLIGLFFNNFLPTGIGGDVTRIYNLIQETGDRTIGFASVMTERLLGIASTLILSSFSLIWLLGSFSSYNILYITLGLLIIIFIFFQIIFSKNLLRPIKTYAAKIKFLRLGERANKLFEAIRQFQQKKRYFFFVILISIIGQTLVIIMTYLLVLSLQLEVSPGYLFLVVPVTFLLTMLPSINGFGVRDGGFIILLAREGISKAGSLSLSFMVIIIPMIVSLIGAFIFIFQKKKTKIEEIKGVQQIL